MGLIHCNCGCGTLFEEFDSRGRKKECIYGHCSIKTKQKISKTKLGKPSPHKGKKRPELLGDKNPFFGKMHSKETKDLMSESHIGKCGENASNWKGGISFFPYCKKFNSSLREKIRERDNRICQLCGKNEQENKRKLSVHHIHYDKENCNPDLISLCVVCNSKVNKNRDYWEEWFVNKLKERDDENDNVVID